MEYSINYISDSLREYLINYGVLNYGSLYELTYHPLDVYYATIMLPILARHHEQGKEVGGVSAEPSQQATGGNIVIAQDSKKGSFKQSNYAVSDRPTAIDIPISAFTPKRAGKVVDALVQAEVGDRLAKVIDKALLASVASRTGLVYDNFHLACRQAPKGILTDHLDSFRDNEVKGTINGMTDGILHRSGEVSLKTSEGVTDKAGMETGSTGAFTQSRQGVVTKGKTAEKVESEIEYYGEMSETIQAFRLPESQGELSEGLSASTEEPLGLISEIKDFAKEIEGAKSSMIEAGTSHHVTHLEAGEGHNNATEQSSIGVHLQGLLVNNRNAHLNKQSKAVKVKEGSVGRYTTGKVTGRNTSIYSVGAFQRPKELQANLIDVLEDFEHKTMGSLSEVVTGSTDMTHFADVINAITVIKSVRSMVGKIVTAERPSDNALLEGGIQATHSLQELAYVLKGLMGQVNHEATSKDEIMASVPTRKLHDMHKVLDGALARMAFITSQEAGATGSLRMSELALGYMALQAHQGLFFDGFSGSTPDSMGSVLGTLTGENTKLWGANLTQGMAGLHHTKAHLPFTLSADKSNVFGAYSSHLVADKLDAFGAYATHLVSNKSNVFGAFAGQQVAELLRQGSVSEGGVAWIGDRVASILTGGTATRPIPMGVISSILTGAVDKDGHLPQGFLEAVSETFGILSSDLAGEVKRFGSKGLDSHMLIGKNSRMALNAEGLAVLKKAYDAVYNRFLDVDSSEYKVTTSILGDYARPLSRMGIAEEIFGGVRDTELSAIIKHIMSSKVSREALTCMFGDYKLGEKGILLPTEVQAKSYAEGAFGMGAELTGLRDKTRAGFVSKGMTAKNKPIEFELSSDMQAYKMGYSVQKNSLVTANPALKQSLVFNAVSFELGIEGTVLPQLLSCKQVPHETIGTSLLSADSVTYGVIGGMTDGSVHKRLYLPRTKLNLGRMLTIRRGDIFGSLSGVRDRKLLGVIQGITDAGNVSHVNLHSSVIALNSPTPTVMNNTVEAKVSRDTEKSELGQARTQFKLVNISQGHSATKGASHARIGDGVSAVHDTIRFGTITEAWEGKKDASNQCTVVSQVTGAYKAVRPCNELDAWVASKTYGAERSDIVNAEGIHNGVTVNQITGVYTRHGNIGAGETGDVNRDVNIHEGVSSHKQIGADLATTEEAKALTIRYGKVGAGMTALRPDLIGGIDGETIQGVSKETVSTIHRATSAFGLSFGQLPQELSATAHNAGTFGEERTAVRFNPVPSNLFSEVLGQVEDRLGTHNVASSAEALNRGEMALSVVAKAETLGTLASEVLMGQHSIYSASTGQILAGRVDETSSSIADLYVGHNFKYAGGLQESLVAKKHGYSVKLSLSVVSDVPPRYGIIGLVGSWERMDSTEGKLHEVLMGELTDRGGLTIDYPILGKALNNTVMAGSVLAFKEAHANSHHLFTAKGLTHAQIHEGLVFNMEGRDVVNFLSTMGHNEGREVVHFFSIAGNSEGRSVRLADLVDVERETIDEAVLPIIHGYSRPEYQEGRLTQLRTANKGSLNTAVGEFFSGKVSKYTELSKVASYRKLLRELIMAGQLVSERLYTDQAVIGTDIIAQRIMPIANIHDEMSLGDKSSKGVISYGSSVKLEGKEVDLSNVLAFYSEGRDVQLPNTLDADNEGRATDKYYILDASMCREVEVHEGGGAEKVTYGAKGDIHSGAVRYTTDKGFIQELLNLKALPVEGELSFTIKATRHIKGGMGQGVTGDRPVEQSVSLVSSVIGKLAETGIEMGNGILAKRLQKDLGFEGAELTAEVNRSFQSPEGFTGIAVERLAQVDETNSAVKIVQGEKHEGREGYTQNLGTHTEMGMGRLENRRHADSSINLVLGCMPSRLYRVDGGLIADVNRAGVKQQADISGFVSRDGESSFTVEGTVSTERNGELVSEVTFRKSYSEVVNTLISTASRNHEGEMGGQVKALALNKSVAVSSLMGAVYDRFGTPVVGFTATPDTVRWGDVSSHHTGAIHHEGTTASEVVGYVQDRLGAKLSVKDGVSYGKGSLHSGITGLVSREQAGLVSSAVTGHQYKEGASHTQSVGMTKTEGQHISGLLGKMVKHAEVVEQLFGERGGSKGSIHEISFGSTDSKYGTIKVSINGYSEGKATIEEISFGETGSKDGVFGKALTGKTTDKFGAVEVQMNGFKYSMADNNFTVIGKAEDRDTVLNSIIDALVFHEVTLHSGITGDKALRDSTLGNLMDFSKLVGGDMHTLSLGSVQSRQGNIGDTFTGFKPMGGADLVTSLLGNVPDRGGKLPQVAYLGSVATRQGEISEAMSFHSYSEADLHLTVIGDGRGKGGELGSLVDMHNFSMAVTPNMYTGLIVNTGRYSDDMLQGDRPSTLPAHLISMGLGNANGKATEMAVLGDYKACTEGEFNSFLTGAIFSKATMPYELLLGFNKTVRGGELVSAVTFKTGGKYFVSESIVDAYKNTLANLYEVMEAEVSRKANKHHSYTFDNITVREGLIGSELSAVVYDRIGVVEEIMDVYSSGRLIQQLQSSASKLRAKNAGKLNRTYDAVSAGKEVEITYLQDAKHSIAGVNESFMVGRTDRFGTGVLDYLTGKVHREADSTDADLPLGKLHRETDMEGTQLPLGELVGRTGNIISELKGFVPKRDGDVLETGTAVVPVRLYHIEGAKSFAKEAFGNESLSSNAVRTSTPVGKLGIDCTTKVSRDTDNHEISTAKSGGRFVNGVNQLISNIKTSLVKKLRLGNGLKGSLKASYEGSIVGEIGEKEANLGDFFTGVRYDSIGTINNTLIARNSGRATHNIFISNYENVKGGILESGSQARTHHEGTLNGGVTASNLKRTILASGITGDRPTSKAHVIAEEILADITRGGLIVTTPAGERPSDLVGVVSKVLVAKNMMGMVQNIPLLDGHRPHELGGEVETILTAKGIKNGELHQHTIAHKLRDTVLSSSVLGSRPDPLATIIGEGLMGETFRNGEVNSSVLGSSPTEMVGEVLKALVAKASKGTSMSESVLGDRPKSLTGAMEVSLIAQNLKDTAMSVLTDGSVQMRDGMIRTALSMGHEGRLSNLVNMVQGMRESVDGVIGGDITASKLRDTRLHTSVLAHKPLRGMEFVESVEAVSLKGVLFNESITGFRNALEGLMGDEITAIDLKDKTLIITALQGDRIVGEGVTEEATSALNLKNVYIGSTVMGQRGSMDGSIYEGVSTLNLKGGELNLQMESLRPDVIGEFLKGLTGDGTGNLAHLATIESYMKHTETQMSEWLTGDINRVALVGDSFGGAKTSKNNVIAEGILADVERDTMYNVVSAYSRPDWKGQAYEGIQAFRPEGTGLAHSLGGAQRVTAEGMFNESNVAITIKGGSFNTTLDSRMSPKVVGAITEPITFSKAGKVELFMKPRAYHKLGEFELLTEDSAVRNKSTKFDTDLIQGVRENKESMSHELFTAQYHKQALLKRQLTGFRYEKRTFMGSEVKAVLNREVVFNPTISAQRFVHGQEGTISNVTVCRNTNTAQLELSQQASRVFGKMVSAEESLLAMRSREVSAEQFIQFGGEKSTLAKLPTVIGAMHTTREGVKSTVINSKPRMYSTHLNTSVTMSLLAGETGMVDWIYAEGSAIRHGGLHYMDGAEAVERKAKVVHSISFRSKPYDTVLGDIVMAKAIRAKALINSITITGDSTSRLVSEALHPMELGQAISSKAYVPKTLEFQRDAERDGELSYSVLSTKVTPNKLQLHSQALALGVMYNDYDEWELQEDGVPVDYDPKNPFNDYFPYCEGIGNHEFNSTVQNVQGTHQNVSDGIQLGQHSAVLNDLADDEYDFYTEVTPSEDSKQIGIVVDYENSRNYKRIDMLEMTPDHIPSHADPLLRMTIVKNGVTDHINATNPFGFIVGNTYRVKVRKLGGLIYVYVNDVLEFATHL